MQAAKQLSEPMIVKMIRSGFSPAAKHTFEQKKKLVQFLLADSAKFGEDTLAELALIAFNSLKDLNVCCS
jgi:hypothetical protein